MAPQRAIPRADGYRLIADFDHSTPMILVKVGRYPLHHGTVGAVRSLGRVGVQIYAITEDRFTPPARSRYLHRCFAWPTTGFEDPAVLLEGLASIGKKLPCRAVALATDDEAAVLLAEGATQLNEWFVLPQVPPELPRQLASKRGLYQLCCRLGVPTPDAVFPETAGDVESYAIHGSFPVVAKNVDPWDRLRSPAVGGTTIIDTPRTLRLLAASWSEKPKVMLQEYIPRHHAEDWIFHGYFDHDAQARVAFTGVKVRSWPPNAGVTTCAVTVPNETLAEQASRFCRALGFRGVVDLDWRFDRRDGRFKLVDFNPRLGAQFRLFQTEAGIDVVQALHLDMTGRPIPNGPPVTGRRFIVEHLDAAACMAHQRARTPSVADHHYHRTEFAWISWDDPAPTVAMATRLFWTILNRLSRRFRQLGRRFVTRIEGHTAQIRWVPNNLGGFENGPRGASDGMSGGLPSN